MELKPSFKQTEIGVIPGEWNVRMIREFASVRGGKRLPLGTSLTDRETRHPYIRVTDMRSGGVDVHDIKYVPAGVFPFIKSYRIYSADLFISVAGTLGIVGKVPPVLDGANLTENADRITDIRCDRDFLLYNLMSDRIQTTIESEQTVGAQPKLALGRIEKFAIAMPPTIDEQRAIATALSDLDRLLAALDRLIAKKRDLKQATMQQLLTGQTRVPGFSGKWETKRLGEMGSFSKGRGLAKDDLVVSGAVPAIPYSAIYTDHAEVVQSSRITHFTKSTNGLELISTPHLLIASSSNMLANIGKATAFIGDVSVAVGGDVLLYRTKADVRFISYLLSTPVHRARVVSLSQGSTIRHVYAATFRDYELVLPPVGEQIAIAAIILDIDAEIAAIEQRRDKTRSLKQGMMQELLTGKTRLV